MTSLDTSSPNPVALDTDIGTDVDDILAIATILGSPELSLAAVTTVYGDVGLRARMVARTLGLAGLGGVPIVPGRAETDSGRAVWWPGHEGSLMPGLIDESVDDDLDATQVLAAHETVAAIGPLTNIAESVNRPDAGIAHIFMMGGEFTDGLVEHNIRCDVTAAATVFGSGVPLSIVGLDQTERIRLDSTFVDTVDVGPLGRALAAEMRQFWDFTRKPYNVPHDPIAIVMLTSPHLFTFATGTITVTVTGSSEGLTTFTPDRNGRHRIVVDLDAAGVEAEIAHRILSTARSTVPITQRGVTTA